MVESEVSEQIGGMCEQSVIASQERTSLSGNFKKRVWTFWNSIWVDNMPEI